MSGLSVEETQAMNERRRVQLANMSRGTVIALLDDFHAASLACVGAHRLPEKEQHRLSLALDRARSQLLEAARAPWREDAP